MKHHAIRCPRCETWQQIHTESLKDYQFTCRQCRYQKQFKDKTSIDVNLKAKGPLQPNTADEIISELNARQNQDLDGLPHRNKERNQDIKAEFTDADKL